jgi:hypothetical protein
MAVGPAAAGPRLAVDLYSGTGGATAAFARHGWRVVRVDLDRGRRPDIVADVGWLPLRGPIDFLWASPPCNEFSDANPRIDHAVKRPSLELVFAALRAVTELRPRFWVIENVRGAIQFLGIPVQKIGPWCLWGYFPPIKPTFTAQTHQKQRAGRSAVARAAIPYELSAAVHQAVELHWPVKSLLDLRPFRRHRHPGRPLGDRPPALFAEQFPPPAGPDAPDYAHPLQEARL